MEKNILLIKNRSDIGAGTRGADMGIDAIEVAAINKGSDFFNSHPHVDVKTCNESVYNKEKYTYARRIGQIVDQCTLVAEAVNSALVADRFPMVFSGDHSSALGTISGIKAAHPDKTLGVIWIDAHADLHSPYTSPSGNIHGMPLAAALDTDNLGCKVNEVEDETSVYWEKLKRIGTNSAKLQPEHLVYFGVRDTEPAEDALMATAGIRNFKVAEVRYRGIDQCVEDALQKLSACDMIYVSFDVDSMDCDEVSHGTGTPVGKGFDKMEIIAMLERIMTSGKVVCFEVSEVNPLLDNKGNLMAETAFDVVERMAILLQ